MKSLVVGGTGFLGGAIAEAALEAGHDVTVLSRGRAQRALSQELRMLQGDRFGDLKVLAGERFDLVFDTCGYTPDAVEQLLQVVGSKLKRYIFISSISVYCDYSKPHLSETDPVPTATNADFDVARTVSIEQRASAASYGRSYGPLKRACEIVAQDRLGDRAILLRAGLLVGKGDYTDRLTWWVRRIDQGGRIPVPASEDSRFQMIDVRDAAAFTIRAAVEERSGPYNLTCPTIQLSTLFNEIIEISGATAELIWVSERKLQEANIQPWTELPLILPPGETTRYLFEVSTEKAHRHGLVCRPVAETVQDLLEWDRPNRTRPLICGISRDQERALLSQDSKS
ncbi:MAG: NAD-dependent epimerase/dehydratase family protein [Geminicoccaceae bacterium]